MERKIEIKKGNKVKFTSGNFQGLTGIVQKVDWHSDNEIAIYGYYHEVLLSDGRTGFIEKSDHWDFSTENEL